MMCLVMCCRGSIHRRAGQSLRIITESNDRLAARLKSFLEGIKFVVFSNFDIKYDARDNTYKVFEINCRQGRSNYYVTATGNSIARAVVEDRVLGSAYTGCHVNDNIIYWRYVPDNVVYKYADERTKALVKELMPRIRLFHR